MQQFNLRHTLATQHSCVCASTLTQPRLLCPLDKLLTRAVLTNTRHPRRGKPTQYNNTAEPCIQEPSTIDTCPATSNSAATRTRYSMHSGHLPCLPCGSHSHTATSARYPATRSPACYTSFGDSVTAHTTYTAHGPCVQGPDLHLARVSDMSHANAAGALRHDITHLQTTYLPVTP